MAREDVVPSPVFPFPPHLTPAQAVAAREEEDERIDDRADKRIGIHWAKCPAVRLRTMLMGTGAVLTLVFSSLVLGMASWINTKLEAQSASISASLTTYKASVPEDVRQVVRDELSYNSHMLQKLVGRGQPDRGSASKP